MRHIRSATLTVLAMVVLAASASGCQSAPDRPTGEILIAADLELTGPAAPIGTAYQRALELRVQQVNESGALGGRKIRLDVKDNRSDASESIRNINDFTANPAVQAIIMGRCNDCVIGAAKTIDAKRVPTIALAPATEVASPIAERRYVFKLAPNAADSSAALAAELKRRGKRKVGLLYTADDYGREGLAAMTGELAKAGIKLARAAQVKSTETDLSEAVRSLTDRKPDALVVWTSAGQAARAANSARESKYAGQLFFDAAAAGELFISSGAEESTDGAMMVFTQTMVIDDAIATTPAKAARKQWFHDYTARFGSYDGFSSFAADAVQLIADAVVKADSAGGAVNRDGIRDLLETAQLDGLSGPIRMTPDNHSGLMPQALTMLVAHDGRWRLAN